MTDPSRETCLATYGTLAPGRANAHQLADLAGDWSHGVVRGHLYEAGWGADLGCPGLRLDADAEPVRVELFRSADLPAHWARLDAFEGAEYERVPVSIETESGAVAAYIYALAD